MVQWNELVGRARQQRQLTQETLADQIGVAAENIQRLEDGLMIPYQPAEDWRAFVSRWAEALDLELHVKAHVLADLLADIEHATGLMDEAKTGPAADIPATMAVPAGADLALVALLNGTPAHGVEVLRRLATLLALETDDLARTFAAPASDIEDWLADRQPLTGDALARVLEAAPAIDILEANFIATRLPQIIRRPAALFENDSPLNWMLAGRLREVVKRYERLTSFQM